MNGSIQPWDPKFIWKDIIYSLDVWSSLHTPKGTHAYAFILAATV